MMKNRSYSFDILRLIACFTVVMCHTSGTPIDLNWTEQGSVSYDFCVVMDALTRWNIAVFVMLSGFFLIDPRKKMPLKSLFSRYILRVVGALVIWSVIYAVTLHVPIYPFGFQEAHFWYLPMILGVYFSIPVLRNLVQDHRLMEYFLIVWACFMLYKFLSNFVVMPFGINDYVMVFATFSGYAVYAYYLKKTFEHPKDEKRTHLISVIIYMFGLIGMFVTVFSGLKIGRGNVFWDFVSPNYIATVTAAFVFAIRHPLKLSGKAANFVENCAKCSFGVYLMHVWVLIQIINRLHRILPDVIPLVLLCWFIAIASSLTITYLLRLIPGLKRIMV